MWSFSLVSSCICIVVDDVGGGGGGGSPMLCQ